VNLVDLVSVVVAITVCVGIGRIGAVGVNLVAIGEAVVVGVGVVRVGAVLRLLGIGQPVAVGIDNRRIGCRWSIGRRLGGGIGRLGDWGIRRRSESRRLGRDLGVGRDRGECRNRGIGRGWGRSLHRWDFVADDRNHVAGAPARLLQ